MHWLESYKEDFTANIYCLKRLLNLLSVSSRNVFDKRTHMIHVTHTQQKSLLKNPLNMTDTSNCLYFRRAYILPVNIMDMQSMMTSLADSLVNLRLLILLLQGDRCRCSSLEKQSAIQHFQTGKGNDEELIVSHCHCFFLICIQQMLDDVSL